VLPGLSVPPPILMRLTGFLASMLRRVRNASQLRPSIKG